jgi:hypothetical protein
MIPFERELIVAFMAGVCSGFVSLALLLFIVVYRLKSSDGWEKKPAIVRSFQYVPARVAKQQVRKTRLVYDFDRDGKRRFCSLIDLRDLFVVFINPNLRTKHKILREGAQISVWSNQRFPRFAFLSVDGLGLGALLLNLLLFTLASGLVVYYLQKHWLFATLSSLGFVLSFCFSAHITKRHLRNMWVRDTPGSRSVLFKLDFHKRIL